MERILTIGVPTFNRARSLSLMLPTLVRAIGQCAAKVELLVSDNCSADSTSRVIEAWRRECPPELSVRTFRQRQNLGASRNLVATLYESRGRYFMFLGDDDQVSVRYFPRLLDLLSDPDGPSAVIQGVWGGVRRSKKFGYVDWHETSGLFYEYGNAWAGVVETKLAVAAIESRGLRERIERIVWPQTAIAFLAMYDGRPRKVFIAEEELGSRLSECMSVYDKLYTQRSLYDLLAAGQIVDEHLNRPLFKSALLGLGSVGFRSHLRMLVFYSLIEKDGPPCGALRALLATHYGVKGRLWAWVLKVVDSPTGCKALAMVFYYLGAYRGKEGFHEKLDRLKREYEELINCREQNNKRYKDWF